MADVMKKNHWIALILLLTGLLGLSVYRTQEELEKRYMGIVLYDQLSSLYSPIGFREGVQECSTKIGLETEYHNASEITVSFLKKPPRARIIVLRMHSGVFDEGVWLFSVEQYSESKYVLEQVDGTVHMARCSSTSEMVFCVGEEFMMENWDGLGVALIILMGCDGLSITSLADVLRQKGSVGVVGWDSPVSIQTSDAATLNLVRPLVDGLSIGEAVDEVNKGYSGERLVYHPESLSQYVLPR